MPTVTVSLNGTRASVTVPETTTVSGIFDWTATGIAPWGGLQAANYGTTSVNGRLRGNAYFTTIGGMPAAQLVNDINPDPATWRLQAVTFTRRYTQTYPADAAYGLSLYVPSVPYPIPNGPQYITMLEPRYVNVGGHGPFTFTLHPTGVRVDLLTGAYDGTNYQFASGRGTAPQPWAIPQGSLAPGWNYIAWTVHWAPDSTGSASFYFKQPGQASWQAGGSFSGVPTLLWNAGQAIQAGVADLLNNYGFAFTQPFTTWYGRYIAEAPDLATVQARMP